MNKDIKLKDVKYVYDDNFHPSQEYLDSLPDIQNGEFDGVPIDFVGINGFKMPIRIKQKDGDTQEVMANITGTVSLDSYSRGINMSRIIRTFYKSKDDIFDINHIEGVLRDYQKDLTSFDAHILMNFQYRIWKDALRTVKEDGTPEGGWQYYNITFDTNLDVDGKFTKIMWVDYKYSSACPCSNELTKSNMYERGIGGIPHSQRSIARVGIIFDEVIWIEDLLDACDRALTTEVLVFCKRIDEQAFSEKNGAQPKFVEDAVRMLANELDKNDKIYDYKIICQHRESLHAHDAIAIKIKGLKNSIFNHHVGIEVLQDMAQHC